MVILPRVVSWKCFARNTTASCTMPLELNFSGTQSLYFFPCLSLRNLHEEKSELLSISCQRFALLEWRGKSRESVSDVGVRFSKRKATLRNISALASVPAVESVRSRKRKEIVCVSLSLKWNRSGGKQNEDDSYIVAMQVACKMLRLRMQSLCELYFSARVWNSKQNTRNWNGPSRNNKLRADSIFHFGFRKSRRRFQN